MPSCLPTAAAFTAGVCWLQRQAALPAAPLTWLLLAGLAVVLAALVIPRWVPRALDRRRAKAATFAAGLLWLSLAAILGAAWAGWRAEGRMATWLRPAFEGIDLALTGTVDGVASVHDDGLRFAFRPDAGARLPDRILLRWYPPVTAAAPLAPGSRWTLQVRLKRPRGLRNPGVADYEAWLLQRGFGATGYVRAGQPMPAGESAWTDRIDRWRLALGQRITAALGPGATQAGVIVALATGERAGIDDASWALFRRTGIGHLVAISGLHIGLVAAMAAALVSAAWRRLGWRGHPLVLWLPAPTAAQVAAALAGLGYGLLSGFDIPARRACLMLCGAVLGRLLARRGDLSDLLGLALLAVVWFDPWAVLAPGFWLSFGAVAAIAAALRPSATPSVARPDAPPGSETDTVVPASPSRLRHWAGRAAAAGRIQLAVSIALVPPSLAWFGQTSLVAPLANALAIPVVGMIVVPVVLLGCLLPGAAGELAFAVSHQILVWLFTILQGLAEWPAAVWQPAAAPGWTVVLASAGLTGAWLARRWHGRGAALVLCGPMLLAVSLPRGAPVSGGFALHFLDVGQGSAVVVRTARRWLVYDTGPSFAPRGGRGADAAQRVVLPFLRSQGVGRLDGLVLSHGDADHSGGAATLLGALPVAWMLAPAEKEAAAPQEGGALDAARRVAEGKALPQFACVAGLRWHWDGVDFEVLHPDPDVAARVHRRNRNRGSCVLRIAGTVHVALLAGDIEAEQEARLVGRTPAGRMLANILLIPHHGSRSSSSEPWLDAVMPDLAVVQAGYRNRFGHPRQAVLDRYRARGVTVLRTDEDGAVEVRAGVEGVTWRRWRDDALRYWHRG